jgi:hypothetical protein
MVWYGWCIVASPFYGANDDSSGEEIANNTFVGEPALGESEFDARLQNDTVTRRSLKAREAFTVPF